MMYNKGFKMLIWVIALIIVLLLCYVTNSIPKSESKNKSVNIEKEFLHINATSINNFAKNKQAEEIEKFGKSLINGEYPVTEHSTIYTKKEYVDAK